MNGHEDANCRPCRTPPPWLGKARLACSRPGTVARTPRQRRRGAAGLHAAPTHPSPLPAGSMVVMKGVLNAPLPRVYEVSDKGPLPVDRETQIVGHGVNFDELTSSCSTLKERLATEVLHPLGQWLNAYREIKVRSPWAAARPPCVLGAWPVCVLVSLRGLCRRPSAHTLAPCFARPARRRRTANARTCVWSWTHSAALRPPWQVSLTGPGVLQRPQPPGTSAACCTHRLPVDPHRPAASLPPPTVMPPSTPPHPIPQSRWTARRPR